MFTLLLLIFSAAWKLTAIKQLLSAALLLSALLLPDLISLFSEWNQQLHVIPAVHRLDTSLNEHGNYILMKSGKKMNQVKEILAQSNRDVLMVENCGMENEHVYRSVEEIPDSAGYYSLIIAKEKKDS